MVSKILLDFRLFKSIFLNFFEMFCRHLRTRMGVGILCRIGLRVPHNIL